MFRHCVSECKERQLLWQLILLPLKNQGVMLLSVSCTLLNSRELTVTQVSSHADSGWDITMFDVLAPRCFLGESESPPSLSLSLSTA